MPGLVITSGTILSYRQNSISELGM